MGRQADEGDKTKAVDGSDDGDGGVASVDERDVDEHDEKECVQDPHGQGDVEQAVTVHAVEARRHVGSTPSKTRNGQRVCDDRTMRIVVGIESGHDIGSVADALRATGARSVQGPAPSLPEVLVAEFPSGDQTRTLNGVSALAGVRYAELDEMRTTLD